MFRPISWHMSDAAVGGGVTSATGAAVEGDCALLEHWDWGTKPFITRKWERLLCSLPL